MIANRYDQILREIRRLQASDLLEVGTWTGTRALAMAAEAIKVTGRASYHGFDLFEDMTPARSKEELNVKEPAPLGRVRERLRALSVGADFAFHLIKGDTRETLPAFVRESVHNGTRVRVDLAWIDGGHSIETVESDWRSVKQVVRPGGVVLLDDYYTETRDGLTDRFGCNELVGRLRAFGEYEIEILPHRDPLEKIGGWVQVVRVAKLDGEQVR